MNALRTRTGLDPGTGVGIMNLFSRLCNNFFATPGWKSQIPGQGWLSCLSLDLRVPRLAAPSRQLQTDEGKVLQGVIRKRKRAH